VKLLGLTQSYGGRVRVQISYGLRALFFAGTEPPADTLLVLELEGLEKNNDKALVEWLARVNERAPARRDLLELPPATWRKAVPDDFLDAANWEQYVWHVVRHMSLAELSSFADRHLPPACAEVRRALEGEDRIATLERAHENTMRIFAMVAHVPNRTRLEASLLSRDLDRARVAEAKKTEDLFGLVRVASRLTAVDVIQTLLREIAARAADPAFSDGARHALLEAIKKKKRLRELTMFDPLFWEPLKRVLVLPPTLKDARVDLSAANEMKVVMNWGLFEADRVGPIRPGRSALVVVRDGKPCYVRGERKLKHRIAREGGAIRRFGNTLVLSTTGIDPLLLEVDRIDTLAQIDPPRALEAVRHLHLAPDDPVFARARAAETDPRERRVLADLLIERAVGIDADVARALARQKARATRR
jgi:hypothetical protein